MTTTAQHVAAYTMYTDRAASIRDVASILRAAGDADLAERLESYAAGYDRRAEDALRDAVAGLGES